MSLQLIKTVTNLIEYELCDGGTGVYAPEMCVPPKIYKEKIDWIGSFFYEPSNDRLVAYMTMRQKAWPGWNALRFEWDAETGEFVKRTFCGIFCIAWVNHSGLGSYNKIFITRRTDALITEVPWNTLDWVSPMWSINPAAFNPTRIFIHALVNLQDSLLVGVGSWDLEVWDFSGTPTLKGSLRLPNTLGYLCMESREICWVITQDGLILKANYKNDPPRWEMLSSVQNPNPYLNRTVTNERAAGAWTRGEMVEEGRYAWTFDGTLAHLPVKPNSVNITFEVISSLVKDAGTGELFLDGVRGDVQLGTINYETGVFSVQALWGEDQLPNPVVDYIYPCFNDAKYFMAWDQKRGRLVVLRQPQDAEDGACQCQFEFYRPLEMIVGLTDPVPVNRHRAGDLVEFVAHLHGSAGEGITPYRVTGSLQAPPQGALLRAEASSAWNGAISLLYQAPDEPGEDTLILEASINDGAL